MEVAETLWLVAKILAIVLGAVLCIASSASLLTTGRDFEDEEKTNSSLVSEWIVSLIIPLMLNFTPLGKLSWLLVMSGYVVIYFAFWSKREEELARLVKNWREQKVIRRLLVAGICLLVPGIAAAVLS